VATSPAVSFKQSCIPELRRVSIYLHDDVAGVLTYFDDIHCHGQLEKLKISGYVDVNNNANLPPLADLRQWLKMSTSTEFTFEMDLGLMSDDDQQLTTLLAEYQQLTGQTQKKYYTSVNILYPRMSLLEPVESDDEDSSDESMNGSVNDWIINACINEVRGRRVISISHIIPFHV
jgi:hypothetical protein